VKTKPELKRQETEPAALKALRRAAKKAVELAQLTGTPAYVLENGRIIDIAKRTRRKRRNHGHA
jgi:hypothetical protein